MILAVLPVSDAVVWVSTKFPTTRFCMVTCSITVNMMKNMRFKDEAKIPLIPLEAHFLVCLSPANMKETKEKSIVK